jgi:hypothetical protein
VNHEGQGSENARLNTGFVYREPISCRYNTRRYLEPVILLKQLKG